MSARCSVAASCFLIGSTVSSSPLWAMCIPPASLICSLPWLAITPPKHKEPPYEYSIQRHQQFCTRLARHRARSLLRRSALLLVVAPRTVGKPLDLHCAIGGRS